jgi:hypothetical protein
MKKLGILMITFLVGMGTLGTGYSAWSQDLDIGTAANPITITLAQKPAVTVSGAIDILSDSATLQGTLTALGTLAPGGSVGLSFDYSTDPNFTTFNNVAADPATWNGIISKPFTAITGSLIPETTYYFRAKAAGSYWTVYSSEVLNFKTPAAVPPVYFYSFPDVFDGDYCSGTTSINKTGSLVIIYTAGNNGHSTTALLNGNITNSENTGHTIKTVTASASGTADLSNLTVTTGGSLGNLTFNSFNQGNQTKTTEYFLSPGTQPGASLHISTPDHSKGTYNITISFTYE